MSAGRDLWDDLEELTGRLGQVAGSDRLRELKRRLAQLEGGAEGQDAEVVSAVPLTAAQQQELEARLRARYGLELTIAFRVDPAILGGVVVRVGDRMVDGSLATRLAQLRETLVGSRGASDQASD